MRSSHFEKKSGALLDIMAKDRREKNLDRLSFKLRNGGLRKLHDIS